MLLPELKKRKKKNKKKSRKVDPAKEDEQQEQQTLLKETAAEADEDTLVWKAKAPAVTIEDNDAEKTASSVKRVAFKTDESESKSRKNSEKARS